jgi:type III pantothenate kinase
LQPPSDSRINASLLILEIGNSHISVASAIKGSIRTNERFEIDALDQVSEHARRVWEALPEHLGRAVVAASVVPDVFARVQHSISAALATTVHVVGGDLRRPISLAVEAPESVGIDRVCCSAAAYDRIRRACVTASFGTAITFDCVNDEGVFMGGAILPGLKMQALRLHEGTAALPEVTIEATGTVYGSTTEQAFRNGIIYGAVGALREITERYATDLHAWPQLVVTGGHAALISQHCEFIDNVVPDLCIRGIALAYRKHFSPFEEESA